MDDELLQKSATHMLLSRTYLESWKRGQEYAQKGKVKLTHFDEKAAEGKAYGTETYDVKLAFKSGGISRSCTCPVNDFCKHEIALAILWDEKRGIPLPSASDIENETIPPPLISRNDIMKAFNDPLHADLEVIRIAADESGRWSRPHARFPQKPRVLESGINPDTIKKSLTEIRSWSRRRNFDPYFCAGETMAAFCEVIRETTKHWQKLSKGEKVKILVMLEEFENELIYQIIDDSDGLHDFSQAHIRNLRFLE